MVKVLVSYHIPLDLRERLQAEIKDDVDLVFAEDEEIVKQEICDAEILFGSLTPELLKQAKKLCWVQAPFASQERHLFPQFIESDILLTNVAGIYNEEIADHVYALILGFTRQIPRFTRNQDKRYWEPSSGFKVDYLAGKTLGVVGLGGIGGEVAKRAPSFGMRVVATRAHPEREKPDYIDQVWGPDGLVHLLAESDFVVICTPETPRTRRMIGNEELNTMKRTAYIVNIGRGAVIDLSALTEALRNGVIAGAGLDVFEIEPLPADHPLWEMENVIITPHMASNTDIYSARRVDRFLDNLSRYLQGKPLQSVVDKEDWH
ncbi:TPA: D-2-hydroxyacid dehydrogenase [Candidatus Poribacteria bacterium]|nr:D-2-hydroxyacid dehydrogenase [Candidatus Poribacteria bacterium]